MKKTLLFTLLALLGMSQAVAQEYEYVPFVREGVKWAYYITNYRYSEEYLTNPARGDNINYYTLELKGDTVINGKTYKVMHKYSGDAINPESDTIPICLREENKIVYGTIPDGTPYYWDAPIYIDNGVRGGEFVLYDFNDPFTFWRYMPFYETVELYADTIQVGQHFVKRYRGQGWGNSLQVLEGFGLVTSSNNSYTLGFFMPIGTGELEEIFNTYKVVEDGEVVYPPNYQEDRYLAVLREGVKWVNERVVVHDGDTVCQYYTYEFKGLHPKKDQYNRCYKALYRYEGLNHELDVETDSIVAGLREYGTLVTYDVNEPLALTVSQDRNMINSNINNALYWLATYPSGWMNRFYYINYQREPFLSDDNFIKVAPIEIDGFKCSRLAYIDAQGDTAAYIVESIGFDSYDMGDLLTPFTRKPDPDADYQEWCGLSHVIRDGKIIYKGRRYRPGASTGVGEAVTDRRTRVTDGNYYNLMGQPVGKEVPTTPGIYIHNGKKIVVR